MTGCGEAKKYEKYPSVWFRNMEAHIVNATNINNTQRTNVHRSKSPQRKGSAQPNKGKSKLISRDIIVNEKALKKFLNN